MSVRGAPAIGVYLAELAAVACGQRISEPGRWQARYTQVYSDHIETIAPPSDSGIFARPGGPAGDSPG